MRIPVFLFLGLLLIPLQTSLLDSLPAWLGMPDLLFLLIVFMAIHLRTHQGALLCLFFGTAMEVFCGYFLGLHVITYMLIFFLIKGISTALAIDESTHQPPIAALGYLLTSGIIYIFTAMLADQTLSPWAWGKVLQRVLMVTILVIPTNRFFLMIRAICDHKYETKSFYRRKKSGNRYRDL